MSKYYSFLLLILCATLQAMEMNELETLDALQTFAHVMDEPSTCFPCKRSTAAIGCCLTLPLTSLLLITKGGISLAGTNVVTALVAGAAGYEIHNIKSEWYKLLYGAEESFYHDEEETIMTKLLQEGICIQEVREIGSVSDNEEEMRDLLKEAGFLIGDGSDNDNGEVRVPMVKEKKRDLKRSNNKKENEVWYNENMNNLKPVLQRLANLGLQAQELQEKLKQKTD